MLEHDQKRLEAARERLMRAIDMTTAAPNIGPASLRTQLYALLGQVVWLAARIERPLAPDERANLEIGLQNVLGALPPPC